MRASLIVVLGIAAAGCRGPYTPYEQPMDAGVTPPGLSWQSITGTPMALPLTAMPMTLAADHDAFYAFGGLPHTNVSTWTYDVAGNAWSALNVGTAPAGRDGHCAATLPNPDEALFIGGAGDSGAATPVTLALQLGIIGPVTYQMVTNDRPTPGSGCVASYLERMSGAIIYGGDATPDDTWLFDGTKYTQLTPDATPGGLAHASMVEDPGAIVDGGVSDFLLMFGGETGGTESDALWLFNGTTWAEVSTLEDPNDEDNYEPRPYGRTGAALAMDPARRLLYVFGGLRQGVYLGDLWRLDVITTQWTQLTLPDGPTGRANASVGYDPIGDRMLIFGGQSDAGFLSDGWALNVTQ